MNAVGIIAEYNPFHNGHKYHIEKVKEMFPDRPIVLVLNGYFLERGDISVLSKEAKTKIALENGVDIVLELPFVYGSQSADTFADAAICLLERLKVTDIVFGSETDNVKLLKKAADIQINNKDYQSKVKSLIDKGLNYPTAMAKGLDLKVNIFNPNDLLGISYIKAIMNHGFNIEAHTIKRTNDFNDTESDEEIVSASNIRKRLKNGEDISKYVPAFVDNKVGTINYDKFYELLKYKILTDDDLSKYVTVDEGIENRIIEGVNKTENIEDLIEFIKTKRYTYNKIKRMLVHILLGFTKEDNFNKNLDYIKVLGFTKNGKNYLNKFRKELKGTLGIKYDTIIYKYEIRSAHIYSLLTEEEVLEYEKRNKPIFID